MSRLPAMPAGSVPRTSADADLTDTAPGSSSCGAGGGGDALGDGDGLLDRTPPATEPNAFPAAPIPTASAPVPTSTTKPNVASPATSSGTRADRGRKRRESRVEARAYRAVVDPQRRVAERRPGSDGWGRRALAGLRPAAPGRRCESAISTHSRMSPVYHPPKRRRSGGSWRTQWTLWPENLMPRAPMAIRMGWLVAVLLRRPRGRSHACHLGRGPRPRLSRCGRRAAVLDLGCRISAATSVRTST